MEQEEKIINFEALKKQIKIETAKRKFKEATDKAKQKAGEVYCWAKEHPAEAASLGASAAIIAKKTIGYRAVKKEEYRRKTEFFDPRTGKYAFSRKPLTTKQQLEAERRYKENRNTTWTQVLYEMGLSK